MFDNRTSYRQLHRKPGLTSFSVTVKETNLHIQAQSDLSKDAVDAVLTCRGYIEAFAKGHPGFLTALTPVSMPVAAPPVIQKMIKAATRAGVGPMAAVAGAVAEYAGRALLAVSSQVVVENGGDIFIRSDDDTLTSIYAGDSPLSMMTCIRIPRQEKPFAVCTSSGTVGHSRSFGTADAVTVVSGSACLADAMATALCNRVQSEKDIGQAIDTGKQVSGVEGLVIIKGAHIGLWGNLSLEPSQ